MSIPRIMHEVFVMDGKLNINPSLGIIYDEPTQENVSRFMLPSTQTQFGAVLYQFYENNLKSNLPNPDSLLQFAKSKLEESVSLVQSLTPQVIRDFETRVADGYDSYDLPRNELFKEKGLSADARKDVATQYVAHSIKERLSQPVRKVYAIFNIIKDPTIKKQLGDMVEEYIGKYRNLLASDTGTMLQLAREKVEEFRTSLEKMFKGESSFTL